MPKPVSIFDTEFETEMVTLERIDNQKRSILRSYYTRGTKSQKVLGQDIKPHTLLLQNVSFGLKSRFQALLGLLENELSDQMRHFVLSGSSITSAKLNPILESIEKNCRQSLVSIAVTDLHNPLKKSTVAQLCSMLACKSGSRYVLTIERCCVSNQTMSCLLSQLQSTKQLNLNELGLTDDSVFQIPALLGSPVCKLQSLSLRNNCIRIEGALALAQGLIDNTSLRMLDLTNNQIGSKGTMLICEALKENKHMLSLFLNGNKIGTEGAYAMSDLLIDKQNNLQELHMAWNLICSTGLNSLFTALAMSNRTLKFLDISYNFVDISVMHSLRLMIERTDSLKYLCVNDLHRFNDRAASALISSLQANQSLRMLDVKLTTRDFYERLLSEVNSVRGEKIEFRRDAKLLVRPKRVEEDRHERREKEYLSKSVEKLRTIHDELIEPVSINMVTPDFQQPRKQLVPEMKSTKAQARSQQKPQLNQRHSRVAPEVSRKLTYKASRRPFHSFQQRSVSLDPPAIAASQSLDNPQFMLAPAQKQEQLQYTFSKHNEKLESINEESKTEVISPFGQQSVNNQSPQLNTSSQWNSNIGHSPGMIDAGNTQKSVSFKQSMTNESKSRVSLRTSKRKS